MKVPTANDLRAAKPVMVLDVPIWDESRDYRPDEVRKATRSRRVPVVIWGDLTQRGAVVHDYSFDYTLFSWVVLREWDEQVLLHELLHIVLMPFLPGGASDQSGHNVIGSIEVALAQFLRIPQPCVCGDGDGVGFCFGVTGISDDCKACLTLAPGAACLAADDAEPQR